MSKKPEAGAKGVYYIEVEGYLNSRWSVWFDGLAISHPNDESTVLSGALPDQTALHSVLNKIRDMNLVLKSVQHVKSTEEER
jgi:hypothetical protein